MSNPMHSKYNVSTRKDSEISSGSFSNPTVCRLPHNGTWDSKPLETYPLEMESRSDNHSHCDSMQKWSKKNNVERTGKTSRVEDVIERMLEYMSAASPISSSLKHVLAFINGESGEKSSSLLVHRSLFAELGAHHVILLSKELFEDPSSLRQRIKEQTVIYHPEKISMQKSASTVNGSQLRDDNQRSSSHRGTILVSGGDGTISFLMDQIQLVGKELEDEFDLGVEASLSVSTPDRCEVGLITTCTLEENKIGTSSIRSNEKTILGDGKAPQKEPSYPPAKELFTLPAIAVIPLGTGNDFSNCLGFGSGIELNEMPLSCCGWDLGVIKLLKEAMDSECIAFDRWLVEFIPIEVARSYLKQPLYPPSAVCVQETSVLVNETVNRTGSSPEAKAVASPVEVTFEEMKEIPPNGCPSSSTSGMAKCRSTSKFANLVHTIDWERVRKDRHYKSRNVTNYVGVGYDSYVAYQFDRFRKDHPKFCSTRSRNKIVYCAMGIKAGTKCKKLRRLVPTVCVPDPFAPATTAGEPDMVALQLPRHAKALLFSNVDSYSGGTHPWSSKKGLYYRPVELHEGAIVSPAAAPTQRPAVMPVSINDGKFEVQAMGGVFDYGFLSAGITSATKIIQSAEAYAFIYCTPNDLRPNQRPQACTQDHPLVSSAVNVNSSKKESPPVKLWVQVDGEAVFPLTEPTILHIQPIREERLYVRCRNPSLLQNAATAKKC